MDMPLTAASSELSFPIEDVLLADIYDGNRLREIEPAWAEAMAASIDQGARMPPVVLRRPDAREGIVQSYALVAGGHRVAAYRLLGRVSIRAEISTYDALQARLAEVQENLVRHDLNALDRALFIAEHKRVWELLNPDAGRGGDRRSKGAVKRQSLHFGPRRFTDEMAEKCGLGERTVKYALALSASLDPEAIRLLRGSSIARNKSELQRLAAQPTERQVRLAKLLIDGTADTVAKARIAAGDAPTGEGDPQEELFRRIVSNWQRLDAKGRKRFMEHAGLVADRKAGA
jgi:ParB family chromosome partitioning protein